MDTNGNDVSATQLCTVRYGLRSRFPVETTRLCSVVFDTCIKSFEAGHEICLIEPRTIQCTESASTEGQELEGSDET